MNTRRNADREIGGAATGVNKVPPQAPVAGMEMSVNSTGLTHGQVTTSLVEMALGINLQAQAMSEQVNRQNIQKGKTHWFVA